MYIVMDIIMDANGIHKIVQKIRTAASTAPTVQSTPMEILWNVPMFRVGGRTRASAQDHQVPRNNPHLPKYLKRIFTDLD